MDVRERRSGADPSTKPCFLAETTCPQYHGRPTKASEVPGARLDGIVHPMLQAPIKVR